MTAKERIEKAIEARSQAKPGPWKFVHGNKIIDNSGEVVAMVAGKWKQDEMEANRNIIAAAPDLVDEVIRLRKWRSEAVGILENENLYLFKDSLSEKEYQINLEKIRRLIAEAQEAKE